jgi:HK97 family phage major capsid protein
MTTEEIMEALRGILDGAEGRDLTDEEVERYEALEGQLQATQRSEQVRARHRAYETIPAHAVHVAAAKTDDTLERAFDAYLRTGRENADLVELRAQSVGSDPGGGYTVPDGFRMKLVDRMKAFGGLANVVEEITTATGGPLEWPTLDDTGNVGEIVAEAGTFAAGADMTFGIATLSSYKYMAGGASNLPLRVSFELLQDSAFDVQGLVSAKLGERIARIQAQHIVRGTGIGQPLGIATGLTGVEIANDTAGITYDDLVDFTHSVDPAYRAGARWAFNDNTLAYMKKMKDADGNPLWRPDTADMATGTGGGTLLGYPVTIDQAFLDFDADSNTVNWGVFGDLREGYVIRRVRDITLIVNPWTRAANGQVEFSAWARMDATQQNIHAYRALTGEA